MVGKTLPASEPRNRMKPIAEERQHGRSCGRFVPTSWRNPCCRAANCRRAYTRRSPPTEIQPRGFGAISPSNRFSPPPLAAVPAGAEFPAIFREVSDNRAKVQMTAHHSAVHVENFGHAHRFPHAERLPHGSQLLEYRAAKTALPPPDATFHQVARAGAFHVRALPSEIRNFARRLRHLARRRRCLR